MRLNAVNFDNFLTELWKLLGLPVAATFAIILLTFPNIPSFYENLPSGELKNILNPIFAQEEKTWLAAIVDLLSKIVIFSIIFVFSMIFLVEQIIRIVGNGIYYALKRANNLADIPADELGNFIRSNCEIDQLFRLDAVDGLPFFRGAYKISEEYLDHNFTLLKHSYFFIIYSVISTILNAYLSGFSYVTVFISFGILLSFATSVMAKRNTIAALSQQSSLIEAAYAANFENSTNHTPVKN